MKKQLMKIKFSERFSGPEGKERYFHVIEIIDVVGRLHLIAFDSKREAEEFTDYAYKRWHFGVPHYHTWTLEQLREEVRERKREILFL